MNNSPSNIFYILLLLERVRHQVELAATGINGSMTTALSEVAGLAGVPGTEPGPVLPVF